jgi:ABC-type branched-subunit amino acid transport system substrate-binding protein
VELDRFSRRRTRVTSAAVFLVLVLVATACGSRLPDQVLQRIDANQAGQSSSNANGSTDGASAGDQSAAAATTGDGSSSSASNSNSSSNASSQSNTGSKTSTTLAGTTSAGACPKGASTAAGVTPTEIKVASMSTDSGPLPGATEGEFRGAAAYFAMVNAAGGICGRKITVLKGDDALDSGHARAEFTRLEPQVLSFVGNLAVADSGYIDLLKSTGVPYVGTTVDPSGRDLPGALPHGTPGVIQTGPYVYMKQQYPDVKKVGYLLSAVQGVRVNSPGTEAALAHVGFEAPFAYRTELQTTSPDYTAQVIAMRNANVQLLFLFAVEVNMQIRLVRNMRQQNWDPPLKVSSIGYNSTFTDIMKADGDGWKTPILFLPVADPNEANASPDVAAFFKWNKQLFPTGQLDQFVVGGWGQAAYFVKALRAIGGPLSRQNVIQYLDHQINADDGGGVSGPFNPAARTGTPCFVMVKVQGGKFVREKPTGSGYECKLGEFFKFQ